VKKAGLLVCALCLLLTGCATTAIHKETPITTPTSSTTEPADTAVTTPTVVIPEGFLKEEQALQIAYDYWKFTPGEDVAVGKGDETDATGKGVVEVYLYPTEEAPYYELVYSWYVPKTDHRSVLDRVWIDAVTGKTYANLPS